MAGALSEEILLGELRDFPPVGSGIVQAYLGPQLCTDQLQMSILVHLLSCPGGGALVAHRIQAGDTTRDYEHEPRSGDVIDFRGRPTHYEGTVPKGPATCAISEFGTIDVAPSGSALFAGRIAPVVSCSSFLTAAFTTAPTTSATAHPMEPTLDPVAMDTRLAGAAGDSSSLRAASVAAGTSSTAYPTAWMA